MDRRLAFVLPCLLAACAASPSRRDFESALDRAVATRATPAGSRAGLIAALEAQQAALGVREQFRLARTCGSRPSNEDHECGVWRGEADEGDETLDAISVTGSRISPSDVLTNNQEAGVDEGDIVKKRGDRLYVLSRARLHTLDIAGGQLRHVQDFALAPPSDDMPWFDEILVAGERLVLLAYDSRRSAAQLMVFGLRDEGVERIAHHEIRIEDYFSGGNYGARIEGANLLLDFSASIDEQLGGWPQWRPFGDGAWREFIDPAAVRVPMALEPSPTLHFVLRCPLDRLDAGLECETRGVVGAASTTFYASADAAYLALAEWSRPAALDPDFSLDAWRDDQSEREKRTLIYRFPFAEPARVDAARVPGWLDAQFAMRDDGNGLLVATRRYGGDPGGGELRVLRIAREQFRLDPGESFETIAVLPIADDWAPLRFLHEALWIGDEEPGHGLLRRQPLAPVPARHVRLPHAVDAIEAVGDAIVVQGAAADRTWTVSVLDGRDARLRALMPVPGMAPSESRSHAFNAGAGAGEWWFGWPVRDPAPPGDEYESFESDEDVSDVALFRLRGDGLALLQRIDLQHDATCELACDDWYGNARLFFIGDRVFALGGRRLVEVRVDGDAVRRVNAVTLD